MSNVFNCVEFDFNKVSSVAYKCYLSMTNELIRDENLDFFNDNLSQLQSEGLTASQIVKQRLNAQIKDLYKQHRQLNGSIYAKDIDGNDVQLGFFVTVQ